VIPIQSKNRERAMMFLNRMHTDPVLVNLLVYGQEGVDYVKKGPTQIDLPPGVKAGTTFSGIYWMMGNESLEYTYGNQDPRFPQLLNDWLQSAIRTPALGFTYDPAKMKNQMAALSNIGLQYDPPISSGSVDPNSGIYQELLGKLKAAGIDDLLADQNGQLGDWLKANAKK
jgi:putative aldouronate transport system substrate-binding protein